MTPPGRKRYDWDVLTIVPRAAHGASAIGRVITVTVAALLVTAGAARADVTTLAGTNEPVVRVNVRHGDVTVRTWDRPAVEIDGDSSLEIERRLMPPDAATTIFIPQDEQRWLGGNALLPAESFVLGPLAAAPHDVIVVRSVAADSAGRAAAAPLTPVVVTVPRDAAVVFVRATDGNLDVHDYRGGTLVMIVGRGHLLLQNVRGIAFVQSNHGPIEIDDSSFERVRVRSLFGNVIFERCNVEQIEATDINGSIVFDGGAFEPGLARFESTNGDVAIGALGPVSFDARSASAGRVYTNFGRDARVQTERGVASAAVWGGGPIVTATTETGNVFLYEGSLRNRPQLAPEWQGPLETLERPAFPARRELGPSAESQALPTRAFVPLWLRQRPYRRPFRQR